MTQLGKINSTYGEAFNIAFAPIDGAYILKGNNLPKHSIIVNDKALFATDYNGNAVRLTYNIIPINGIIVNNDVVELSINDKYINADNNILTVYAYNLIDNNTLVLSNTYNTINVNVDSLDISTSTNLGVVSVDDNTIFTNNDNCISVNTTNLLRANNDNIGIVVSDNDTINISNDGVISVVTSNLDKGTNDKYGISKPDGITITSNNGIYSVVTYNLSHIANEFGVSKSDNNTIISDNGIYSVDTQKLSHASTTDYGVVRLDNSSIGVNDNGAIYAKQYDYINSYINDLSYITYNLNIEITNLENKINDLIG